MKLWNLVEWAFVSHFTAFGVGVTVAAFDKAQGTAWQVDAALSYLLTVSITSYTYALFGMRRPIAPPPPPAPKPEPRRIPELYPLPLPLRRKERNYDSDASGVDGEWAVIGLDHYKLLALKKNLAEYGMFSWRKRPVGMNVIQYQRVRTFLLARKWGELYRGGVRVTAAGKLALSPIEPA